MLENFRANVLEQCRPFQIYQSTLGFSQFVGFPAGKPWETKRRLVDLKRPAIAEFGTDHIERAVFVTSASIFLETFGGMKLKFGEEIEKKLIYQDPSPFR